MPVYTYRREDGTTFEEKQGFLDEPLFVCPTTGQKVVRIIQKPNVIFKGTGFYVNDSKSASKHSANGGGNGNSNASTNENSGKNTGENGNNSTSAENSTSKTSDKPKQATSVSTESQTG